jgi:hypothetical protein
MNELFKDNQEATIAFEDDYDVIEIVIRHVTRHDGATSSWIELEAESIADDNRAPRLIEFRLTKGLKEALIEALQALPDDVESTGYGPALGQA